MLKIMDQNKRCGLYLTAAEQRYYGIRIREGGTDCDEERLEDVVQQYLRDINKTSCRVMISPVTDDDRNYLRQLISEQKLDGVDVRRLTAKVLLTGVDEEIPQAQGNDTLGTGRAPDVLSAGGQPDKEMRRGVFEPQDSIDNMLYAFAHRGENEEDKAWWQDTMKQLRQGGLNVRFADMERMLAYIGANRRDGTVYHETKGGYLIHYDGRTFSENDIVRTVLAVEEYRGESEISPLPPKEHLKKVGTVTELVEALM